MTNLANHWDNADHDPSSIAAAIQFDNEVEIDRYRMTAAAALIQALTHLDTARRAVEELRSNAVYDIKLAEGHPGPDIAEFIADSLRLSRAAYAIIRRIEDGG